MVKYRFRSGSQVPDLGTIERYTRAMTCRAMGRNRGWICIVLGVALVGCFNPDETPPYTDTGMLTSSTSDSHASTGDFSSTTSSSDMTSGTTGGSSGTEGESSTGEESTCPGGAPTPGDVNYVQMSIDVGEAVTDLDLGDLDADGDLDLVTVTYQTSVVHTLFGDGTGMFSGNLSQDFGDIGLDTIRLRAIADDTPDIIIHDEAAVRMLVARGDGTGNWLNTQEYDSTYIRAIDVADFNNDGAIDITYIGATALEVRLGVSSNETFSAPTNYGTNYGRIVRVGDITGDGVLDIINADDNNTEMLVYVGQGNGSFTAATSIVVAYTPTGVDVGDVDGDGNDDLVLSTTEDLRVFYGQAGAQVSSTPGTVVSGATYSAQLADIDADGDEDVITRSSEDIEIRFSNGDRTLASPVTFSCPNYVQSLRITDVNGDCVPDLVAATGETSVCAFISVRD